MGKYGKESPQTLGNDQRDFSGLSVGGMMVRLAFANSRCGFVAACFGVAVAALAPVAPASAEPSHTGTGYSSFSDEQRARELYLDGIEKLQAGHDDVARRMFESVVLQFPETGSAQQAQNELSRLVDSAIHSVAEFPAIARAGTAPNYPEDAVAPMAGASLETSAFDAQAHSLHARYDAAAVAVTGEITTGSLPLPVAQQAPKNLYQGFRPTPAWDQEVRRNASIQTRMRLEAGDRVFFSAGSAELGSRARMALAAQALWLKRWHEFEATISGYADEPGSDEDNVALSVKRATAVRQRLIDEGVEPSRLAVAPHGRSGRVAMCADAGCQAQNRRAITVVFVAGTHARLGLTPPPIATAARIVEDDASAVHYENRDERPAAADGHDNSALVRQVGVSR
ncbi:OmpA family protein [Hyphomicrobium sulfonivorans]|uniref:OmpA family protein n=1 Tax=Hyphomicrobium sulfonivorans TaxID=121290 RepID=UPI0018E0E06D|nr:OmpA family protein [Hyphomicrobium sulfonivorans]MBI1649968.1 OmpA family protein [Hyphomicrobium sulfonivorans]